MKNQTKLFTALCLAALAVGCNQEKTTSQQLNELKAETKAVAAEMQDYTFAQKTEFAEKMQSQLAAINADLDQLAAKIEKSSTATQAEARPKLQALREKADQLGRQLDQVKSATASTWDNVKAGTKKAYDELKDGFHQSRQWLSEKIAP